jgi:hypothetical protein
MFVFAVLEFELRALYLLSRCSTTGAMPPAIFASVIFQINVRACFLHMPSALLD